MSAFWFIIIGAMATIAAAYFQEQEKIKEKETALKKEQQRSKEYESIIKNQSRTIDTANRIIELQNKLVTVNQKLREKSEYIQNFLTGGDGFPYLDAKALAAEQPSQFNFQVFNDYAFPLYASIDVFDYDKIDKSKYFEINNSVAFIKRDDFFKAKILDLDYTEIPSKQSLIIDNPFPIKEARYYVEMRTRNQTIIQKLVSMKDNNKKYYAYQVLSIDGSLLKQFILGKISKAEKEKILERLNSIPNNLTLNFAQ